jgi:hypothetical protein
MSGGASVDLLLSCKPNREGNSLVFPYTLQNRGGVDVYVMDAFPSVDPASHIARANDQASVVILGAEGDAVIGKFIAPLPGDRRVALSVVPLARRLAPGETIERRLEVQMPLAEASPYFADLPLRGYEMIDIRGVAFTIGYWSAQLEGFATAPADYAPGLFVVALRDPRRGALRVTQRFPVKGLQLFKRGDAFPRELG